MNKKYIRELIKIKKVKIKHIESAFGISRSNVYLRLRGSKEFTISEAKLLANLLDMSLSAVFDPSDKQLKNVLIYGRIE